MGEHRAQEVWGGGRRWLRGTRAATRRDDERDGIRVEKGKRVQMLLKQFT